MKYGIRIDLKSVIDGTHKKVAYHYQKDGEFVVNGGMCFFAMTYDSIKEAKQAYRDCVVAIHTKVMKLGYSIERIRIGRYAKQGIITFKNPKLYWGILLHTQECSEVEDVGVVLGAFLSVKEAKEACQDHIQIGGRVLLTRTEDNLINSDIVWKRYI